MSEGVLNTALAVDDPERRAMATAHIRAALKDGALGYSAPEPFLDDLASFVWEWTLYLTPEAQVARAVEIGRTWR